MKRRTLLKAVLAAPFVISARRPKAFLAGGPPHSSPPSGDATAQILASLPANTWSGNIVPTGFTLDDVAVWDNLPPGESCSPPQGEPHNLYSYSSGVWVDGKKRYIAGSPGGHSAGLGAGVMLWDATTAKWRISDGAPRYGHNPTDTTFCTGGVGAYTGPNSGLSEGLDPIGNTGPPTYFVWPNANGHLGPGAGHLYSQTVWCPDINWVFRTSNDGFIGSVYTDFLWRIDPDTGEWDQDPAVVQPWIKDHGATFYLKSGDAANTPITALITWNFWIPELQRILIVSPQGAQSLNPLAANGDATKLRETHSYTIVGSIGYVPDLVYSIGTGCIVDDPLNPGHRACVFFANNGYPGTPSTENVCVLPKVDVLPATNQQWQSAIIPFGNTVPYNLTSAASPWAPHQHNSIWFEGKRFKAGSTKIIVWSYANMGFYILDMVDWTFSNVIPGSTPSFNWTDATNGYRLCQPMSDYSDANNVAFMLTTNNQQGMESQGIKGGSVFLYKLPTSLL